MWVKRDGFTLIELLVVIGIISILAGMLLPALTRTRDMAKQAVCSSQLKQIHLADTLYQDNNRGYMGISSDPHAAGYKNNAMWSWLLREYKYLPSRPGPFFNRYEMVICPGRPPGASIYYPDYGYNRRMHMVHINPPLWKKASWVPGRYRDACPVMIDGSGDLRYTSRFPEEGGGGRRLWHLKRSNCLYLDGHIRDIPHTLIQKSYDSPPFTAAQMNSVEYNSN